jgi:hypothetical protein
MEVDGMYENTPWERLALWAPWIGIAVVLAAIILAVIVAMRLKRMRAAADVSVPTALSRAASRAHQSALAGTPNLMLVAGMLTALGLSLATLGGLFTIMWRPAHDTYPTKFGTAAIWVAGASIVVALLVSVTKRSWRWNAFTFGLLTASAAAAAAISAYSHSIIAEGQVTAMVLPIGYVVSAILATAIASFKYDDAVMHEAISVLVFIVFAFVATQKLPVVQFRADSSLYPVTGALYIVLLGRLARIWMFPAAAQFLGAIVAIAIGYLLAQWYGIAIAFVGLSISGALDPRRLTTVGSSLPHASPT